MLTPRHLIIKMANIKYKETLKGSKGETPSKYKLPPIKLPADFSVETLQAKRDWHEIFQIMRRKYLSQDYSIQQVSHLKWKAK